MDDIEVRAFIDGARDAVRKALADVRIEADRAEALRAAEHRAFMAESREADSSRDRAFSDAMRVLNERIAAVKDGVDGLNGRDGVDGKDGLDGALGRDGVDGANGKDGLDGVNGTNGTDGRDGHDVDEITVEQDGAELAVGFTVGDVRTIFNVVLPAGPQGPAGNDGLNGETGPQGPAGDTGQNGRDAYPGEARGLFNSTTAYRALDVVSFNGCEWRAKRDDPGDLPGEGWMLSASKGKRGDRGERGLPGAAGASLVAAYVDREALQLVLTRDDGVELKADLFEFTKLIREDNN